MKYTLNLERIKQSAIKLSTISEEQRNTFLRHLSKVLLKKQKEIIEANKNDVSKAEIKGLPPAFIDRLTFDEIGIKKLILKLKDIEKLQCGTGEVIEEKDGESNLLLKKVRVSLGVIAVIYEARPEVTIDVAALCVKSGNIAILKGGSEAIQTNKVLYSCISYALEKSGLVKEAVSFISSNNRRITNWLLTQNDYIDLVIARGGYGLMKMVLNRSKIPVLAHAAGGARIYVDETADLSIAEKVIINAKTNKPAACNSLDAVLIHKNIADTFIPHVVAALKRKKVMVLGDEKVREITDVSAASENDWGKEFLELTVAIKVVENADEAITFINKHGKRHSEGLIATDKKIINYFTSSIDAAALFINCSTRLHDGYVFGFGSEMGIATGKLHARGPVGLKELTSYKWEVYGNGHIRK